MAIYKCKMCGGTIEFEQGSAVGVCDSCGTKQTLPKTNDDVIANLFNRANNLRLKCEFDKAAQIYEKIVEQDDSEAEAHWGIVLCKYGIEYVEDPKTFQRIPTCHRTLFQAVTTDADYLTAVEQSDMVQRQIYEDEARAIDKIQKDILAIVKNEQPFDVFICYKETDEAGKRTIDSAIANDIYHQLTQEGFKVFYAAITLEDKLGQEYEPYIFAALNSAKVMLVLGTKPEHFSAVWVKNEWSRFLQLMKSDRTKLLIPCYRDMDAYDLPEEFAHLQAQDMGKIGFINDVVRGIKKVAQSEEAKTAVVTETVVMQNAAGNATVEPLLERVDMFLEDGEFDRADEFCEQVLNIDPKNVWAYRGKLMAELRVKKQEELKNCAQPFDGSGNYQKVMRFGDEALKAELTGYIEVINNRNEQARLQGIYDAALAALEEADTEEKCVQAAEQFESIPDFKDAAQQAQACREKAAECAEEARKDDILAKATRKMWRMRAMDYEQAIQMLESIPGWKDADQLAEECRQKKAEIEARAEQARLARIRALEELEAQEKRNKKIALIAAIVLGAAICVAVLVSILLNTVVRPASTYSKAEQYFEQGNLAIASMYYSKLGDYKDAPERVREIRQQRATFATTLSAGENVTAGVRTDGMTQVTGADIYGQSRVSGWTDIVEVAAGSDVTVGLKADGTVVAVDLNEDGQCNVSGWTDIEAVAASSHVVGLKADGTVVATGENDYGQCNVSGWTDIVAVATGSYHTVGLKSDGTVVAVGLNEDGQCNVSGWTDIVAVSAGEWHTVGLKADGTMVATGRNNYGQCDVSGWTDIVAVSAGAYHTVGLKVDGTMVATGRNYEGRCDVSGWTDIVAVSAGWYHTVGLKSDGTVVAVGSSAAGKCNVFGWRIKLPD